MLELPDQTRTGGPVQVHQQMTNNGDIRQQLNLLSPARPQVQYGNLLSLPFADGMLYVEPVYVKSNQQDAFPLLKVLLSYGDGGSYVVLANNLSDGIRQLVAGRAAGGVPGPAAGPGRGRTLPRSPARSAAGGAAAAGRRASGAGGTGGP